MPKKAKRQEPRKSSAMSRFEMLMPDALLRDVEEWAARQPSRPNKSEAIRRLIEMALQHDAAKNK
jgi:metal-responsive CopG/Arc/MetJ family transcriptional regulator